jgi:tetratricopeptide (TPR) repeat protein
MKLGGLALTQALAALLLLAGCATPQISALEAQWPEGVSHQAQLTHVPFIAQEDFECGPASLAMAFQAAGVSVAPAALVDQVYLPGKKGSLQIEMLATTRRNGLLPYVLRPEIADVLREVAAGHPVVVFQNLSLPVYPVWHYAVVIGYDRHRNLLTLHSGTSAATEISLNAFERTWARGNNWAMVALPPSELAATATPERLAQAIAALERVQPAAALLAYTRGLQAWPLHAGLMLGEGNAAYAMGDAPRAERAYMALVEQHPDFADGWNNLAQVLSEREAWEPAKTAIDRAVAIGGPRIATYQRLQAQLQGR